MSLIKKYIYISYLIKVMCKVQGIIDCYLSLFYKHWLHWFSYFDATKAVLCSVFRCISLNILMYIPFTLFPFRKIGY